MSMIVSLLVIFIIFLLSSSLVLLAEIKTGKITTLLDKIEEGRL